MVKDLASEEIRGHLKKSPPTSQLPEQTSFQTSKDIATVLLPAVNFRSGSIYMLQ